MFKMPSSPKRNEKLSRLDVLNKAFKGVLLKEYVTLEASDCPYQNLVKIFEDVASFMSSYDKIFKTPQIEPSAPEAKELSNTLDALVTAINKVFDENTGKDFYIEKWYLDDVEATETEKDHQSVQQLLTGILKEVERIQSLLITPGSPKPQG